MLCRVYLRHWLTQRWVEQISKEDVSLKNSPTVRASANQCLSSFLSPRHCTVNGASSLTPPPWGRCLVAAEGTWHNNTQTGNVSMIMPLAWFADVKYVWNYQTIVSYVDIVITAVCSQIITLRERGFISFASLCETTTKYTLSICLLGGTAISVSYRK